MPVSRRRLARLAQLAEEAVQLAGRDPRRVLLEELLDAVEEPCRRRGPSSPRRRRSAAAGAGAARAASRTSSMPTSRDVPLGEDDERRATSPCARRRRPPRSLLDDALGGVDEDERDVGALRRLERAQLRVVLDPLALLALAAQAGGVDEDERLVAALQHRVDRVARRPGTLGDDHPLLAEERVQERRLADVRPAEDRDADRLLADLGAARARAAARRSRRAGRRCRGRAAPRAGTGRRGRAGGTRARSASRRGSSILFAIRIIGLCDARRIARAPRRPGVIPARASTTKRTRSASAIAARAWSAICCVSGERVGDVDAAGVDEQEARARPLADELLAVARDAGRLVHDGLARAGQPVDERGLADVREADDRDRAERARSRSRRRGARRPPSSCCSTSQSPEAMDLCLDERRRLAVALARRGSPSNASAAPGDRDRVRSSRLPRTACRGSPPGRPARPPGARPSPRPACASPGNAGLLPRALDEEPERESRRGRSARIARTASRSDSPRRTESVPKARISWPRPGVAMTRLRQEVDRARAARAERRRIEPGEVVHREHDPALGAATRSSP